MGLTFDPNESSDEGGLRPIYRAVWQQIATSPSTRPEAILATAATRPAGLARRMVEALLPLPRFNLVTPKHEK